MRKTCGFTLIELLIATIIVGVLVAVSVPLYLETAEKAMGAKALENMHVIFNAQTIYSINTETYSNNIALLESYAPVIDDDGDWQYAVSRTSPTGFDITATRINSTAYNGNTLSIDEESTITGLPYPP